jgi:hypothetical protein
VVVNELEGLRAEHAGQVIGPRLAELLARIVDATAPSYPPSEYSDARVWNRDALDDVLQDWTLTRLLERGDLSVMLAAAGSSGALRGMLTRSFTQHLINRRRRTSATNLFSRTVALLSSDNAFHAVARASAAGEQRWTLASHPAGTPASPGTVGRLIKAAGTRTDAELGVVRYGPYALKSSPILRGPALREFVAFLLAEADGDLTAREIFEVMRHRFNLVELPPVELNETLLDLEPPVPTAVETRLLAASVLARVGRRNAELIRAVAAAEGDPLAAADAVGAAPTEVAATLDAFHALIAEYAESADEAVAVHRQVIESLFYEGEAP